MRPRKCTPPISDIDPLLLLQDKVYASPCHFHCETCWGRCCTGTGCELWGDFDSDCSWALPKACRCDTQQYDVESDSETCYDTDAETGSDADVEEPFINYMKLFAAAAGPVSDKVALFIILLSSCVAWPTQTHIEPQTEHSLRLCNRQSKKRSDC